MVKRFESLHCYEPRCSQGGGGGVGMSECWPKKKPGQIGPSKNGQHFGQPAKKIEHFESKSWKKKGQQILLASQFLSLVDKF